MAQDMPARMTAIEIEGGMEDAQALRPAQIATPNLPEGMLGIAVRTAGVNRPDILSVWTTTRRRQGHRHLARSRQGDASRGARRRRQHRRVD